MQFIWWWASKDSKSSESLLSAQNYTRAYTNDFLVHLSSGHLALDGNLVKYCLVMLNLVKSC